MDTVITLCSEEECPLFLGQARRFHWSLPDPAAVQGSDEERLVAFRRTRDDLRRRIAAFLAGANQQKVGRTKLAERPGPWRPTWT